MPNLNKYQFLLFVILSYCSGYSQNDTVKLLGPSKNHFTIRLQNGFNVMSSVLVVGSVKPNERVGHVNQLDFKYTHYLSKTLGVSLTSGFGAFPTIYEFKELNLGRIPYYADVEYTPYLSLNSDFIYQKKLSKKYFASAYLGYGLVKLTNHISYSDFTNNNERVYYAVNDITKSWKHFVKMGLGISKVLKNENRLSLTAGYQHSFDTLITGYYFVYPNKPNFSYGKLFNKGNFISLGLEYTFTGDKRRNQINEYINTSTSLKEGKRKFKRDLYEIKEQTTFFSAFIGSSWQLYQYNETGGIEYQLKSEKAVGGIAIEQNLRKNTYAEVGFAFQEYYSNSAYQFSFGMGKRIINKSTNYNFINLNAGVAGNFTDANIGTYSYTYRSFYSNDYTILPTDTVYQNISINKSSALFYIGASKDFRLAKKLYFSILYRYYQGTLKMGGYKSIYPETPFNEGKIKESFTRGSFHTLQFALKYNLGNLTEKQLERNIDPHQKGSLVLTFSGGMGYYHSKVQDNYWRSNSIYNSSQSNFIPSIGASYFLNNNQFTEARMSYQRMYFSEMIVDIASMQIGAGSKINLPKGLNLFSVHGGAQIILVTKAKGRNGSDSNPYYNEPDSATTYLNWQYDENSRIGTHHITFINGNDTLATYFMQYELVRKVKLMPYLGVSKEIHISNNWSTELSYFRSFGLGEFFNESNYSKVFNLQNRTPGDATETYKGGNSMVQFSLKYRLK